MYQRFFDNLSIAYAGNEEKYTKLTVSDVESVIRDLDDDIAKAEARRVREILSWQFGTYRGDDIH